ncbi:UvrD-helicase domain-containing protein [Mycobacterium terramassiliense]|uniref:DNA 3'-5' helicase n=1 Tax=Mycobacterium terramassiliense TaxID=1841859 RepID=A0A2U3NK91_9MYCO|nr:UvrD-helicase domain-containing protein [Mycobacterium terramassiliense]SPM31948.1 Superfamily I DNA or RNA helicase [Mycobacterium terramassiliense]
MTSRTEAPDTDADREIRAILDFDRLTGFTVNAGAGSGKTTSLVKALAHITRTRGSALLAKTQQVACITYTEVAAQEIHADLGNDPLASVSTIHSFLWSLVQPFQKDIGAWVATSIDDRIGALVNKQQGYLSGTKAATKAKDAAELEKWERRKLAVDNVTRWQYGIGSDYGQGVLGHADILKMVPQMILTRGLFARLVARRFPFIFVDESQDTFTEVVEALKHVRSVADGKMCLGFFGDPMQQIYMQGVGSIAAEPGWRNVDKPENFRSSKRVLACINAIRAEGDTMQQVSGLGDAQLEGEAYFFVLPADDHRSQNLERVRAWLDYHSQSGNWTRSASQGGSKVLMIAHRMAARRLGFDALYAAFHDNGSASLDESFSDGTAWPLKPFRDVIVPLCAADHPSSPEVLGVLRQHSPVLRDVQGSPRLRADLATSRAAVTKLRALVSGQPNTSLGELLTFASEHQLIELDPRVDAFLHPDGQHRDVVLDNQTRSVLEAMVQCAFAELNGYEAYVKQESPYSTQHGTKGAEFDRVVVVLDDDEGNFNLYSYDKLLGLKPLSDTDLKNRAEGRDSAIERTRRLFYVCVSRAKQAVAVVLFATDAAKAAEIARQSALASHADVLTLEDL